MRWVASKRENLISFLQKGVSEPCSKKFLRRVLEANLCRVNGQIERFGSIDLQRGDRVELAPSWKSLLKPETPSFTTLYEDEACLIVNKGAGWICDDAHCKNSFGPHIFLVHRLDKETTGALLLAKGAVQRDALMLLFKERNIEKEYLAIADGHPAEKEGLRETFLTKKKLYQGQTLWGSAPRGDKAITRWKVLAYGNQASLIQCEPVTGRTHQIRVHLSEMSHPILIDRQYGTRFRSTYFAQRPLLHARKLRFSFRGKKIEAEAPLPSDMRSCMLAVVPEANALI